MPTFNKQKRYIDKKGKQFGGGVWFDDKGIITKPGTGIYDRKAKETWEGLSMAERQQHMNNMRFFMNLMDYGKPKSDGSSFMSTIGMLADNGMDNPYSLDSRDNGGNNKSSELTLMPMFSNMYAGGNKIERRKGVKGGVPVEYLDASEVMPILADNMGRSIVLDEVEVTPSRGLPMQSGLFEGITNQAANERADEYANATANLSPFFADLMTGMMSSQMHEGAEQWKEGKKLQGLFNMTAPLMFAENFIGNSARAGYGLTHLTSDNGVSKTYNHLKDGEYGSAALSGLGDLLDVGLAGHGFYGAGKLAKPVYERVVQPGMKLFNSPLTGNWVRIGSREYRLSPNSLGINGSPLESRVITPQITAENAASITPEQWIAAQDAAYKNAVMSGNRKKALELLDEAYKRSGVPETIITTDASGRPKIWYTGSEYGNHTVFDSSKFNATIGGESAVGKIKGNFLTTDLPSAARYAGSGVNKVKEFTEPSTFLEKIQNIFGMYKPERIHPTDKIPETLRPKPDRLFTIKDADVIDYVDETDNVVYPMYVNPGERVYTVDFKGNPWSRSPVKFPNAYRVKKTVRDDVAKTYRDEIIPFKDRETAVEYYKSLEDRFGKTYVEDPSKLNDKYFPHSGGDRSVEMFASAPSYEKASLIETHTPATTNGAVQTAEREGYTSVYMPNVIDSNVRGGNPYAIDDFVTLDSRQMKMADITYDDAGNLIPLSKRFNWNNPDIRYQLSDGINSGNTPWTQENAQEAADWATTFFTRDVQPRLVRERAGLEGTRFTENSPFLGRFSLGEMPTSTARGMTEPIIQETGNGTKYVTTMNAKDLSSIEDKIGGLVHEMREDMTNFHKGIYDTKIQELMKNERNLVQAYNQAMDSGDYISATRILETTRDLQKMAAARGMTGAVTANETQILKAAYKLPKNPMLDSSGNIEEMLAENTRFRAEASKRRGGKVMEELDAEIDKMSDEEVMDILSSGDSYGQDYAQYIKENPRQKEQMIKNIKKAWKKVAVFTGVVTTTMSSFPEIIQGRVKSQE